MSAPESHKLAGLLDQPSGVNITVAKADENGRRIECDPCVAPDNSLQGERVAMGHGLGHPGISRGKAGGVELVLFGECFSHRLVVDWVARLR